MSQKVRTVRPDLKRYIDEHWSVDGVCDGPGINDHMLSLAGKTIETRGETTVSAQRGIVKCVYCEHGHTWPLEWFLPRKFVHCKECGSNVAEGEICGKCGY